jgi:Regulator of ribonuclease activity B
MDYPNDADGDALRRVARDGSDMTRPMDVDFAVAVPDEMSGLEVAKLAQGLGYRPDVVRDDESGSWTCCCTRSMVLTYAAVIAAQAELDRVAGPVGGASDGWGTFGNAG